MKHFNPVYIYALIAIFLWSTKSSLTKLLLNGSLGAIQLVFWGSLFSLIFVLAANAVKKNLHRFSQYKAKDYLRMTVNGLLGIGLYEIVFCLAAERMPVQDAFIINYLWPVATVVFACIVLKEKLTVKKVAALLVSFAGVIIVLTKFRFSSLASINFAGALFAFLAAVFYGLFCALSKKCQYDSLSATLVYLVASVIVSGISLLISGTGFKISGTQILGCTWIGIFTYSLPLILWENALRRGNTATVSNLAYITPFLSLIIIKLVLPNEKIEPASVIGLIIIVAGIFIQLGEKKKAQ